MPGHQVPQRVAANSTKAPEVFQVSVSPCSAERKETKRAGNLRPIITEYDSKKRGCRTELADLVLNKYKCDKNDVPITVAAGSTTPLVEKPANDEELGYNPFEHRDHPHPTTDCETLIHLLKGSLGSGILAMPLAFYNSGLLFGLIAIFIVGFVCTYCVHILVKCAHILCRRSKVPTLGFSEVAEAAFLTGPPVLQKFSGIAAGCINTFLVIDLIGCCCVYIVFVAKNIKQVVDFYSETEWPIQYYMLIMAPVLILINWVRNLKYLSPFSMLANILISIGLGITFYYIFSDLPSITNSGLPNFSSWGQLPLFFGTAIFALEGIGVVMPLENSMKTPTHFIGCPGVLNIGMAVVVSLYTAVGFFGYLKYGDKTEGSITLNLPTEEVLAQSVKVMIAVAIFFTYSLQFYVPFEIIWKATKHRFGSRKTIAEYVLRTILVICTVGVAAAVPNLGPIISLVGAVCLSTLGLMFPAIIELATYWESPGLGSYYWRLWKNVLIILFGVLGFVTGTWTSIQEIVEEM
ncbi:proton-coupled amino acid transporter-like protein pathetic [Schistocerca cancellata]|uniref:proton-coupled amino acid transporter-like protein pathetic n=1 Tax=Schistocerca cancellata TaxID=274614 RepID=UPI0021186F58|nr:proton-coupled amino acid transporter-like protein pathetic [Schistocerca cancellata]